ncbi:MAG: ATP-binding protein [Clostridia bacterium]|nr:ATP-binding protein [Clostridia bacterium]
MNKILKNFFSKKMIFESYESYKDYLIDEMNVVFLTLDYYLEADKKKNFENFKNDALNAIAKANFYVKSRLECSKEDFFAGKYIKETFIFSDLEWFCLMVVLIKRFSPLNLKKYSDILGGDSFDFTYEDLIKIYFFKKEIYDIENFYDIMVCLKEKLSSLCFKEGELEIDDYIFKSIVGNSIDNFDKKNFSYFKVPEVEKKLIIREDLARRFADFSNDFSGNENILYFLYGEKGIGKKTLAKRICEILKKGLLEVNLAGFKDMNKDNYNNLMSAMRFALCNKFYISFCGCDKFEKEVLDYYKSFILNVATKYSKIVFVISENKFDLKESFSCGKCLSVEVEDLSLEESFKIWENAFSNLNIDKTVDVNEISNKFEFTPLQIINTCVDAENIRAWKKTDTISKEIICKCAYEQVADRISDKAILIKKKHTWDELVLPEEQKKLIIRACNQIKYKNIVYDKWGMDKKVLYGRGLSMLFSGPSGTGKTMAAQVVANELGLEIYRVDLSKVVSKYIGETEKNLGEIFESAKKSNVILLFDETDAIFGKRTEVKDSHDKNANVETSYLLQKMEEYNGVTIMTTNFIGNIDKAFFRRINYVVHFTLPDAKLRKEIWQKMYPKETPISEDVDFDFLARHFEVSGGSIKNIVITSSFIAASESNEVKMEHIIKSLEYEIKKQGKIVSKSDFGEYGYLL